MKRIFYAILVLSALPVFAADWAGVWVGGTTALGKAVFVQAEISQLGSSLSGTMEVPAQDAVVPLEEIRTSDEKIQFRMPTPYGIFLFEGMRDNSLIRGRVKTPMGTEATMHLRRTEDRENVEAFAGTFLFPDGEHVITTPRPRGQLRMIGTKSLTSTRLVPVEGDRFLDAASIAEALTGAREFTFVRDTNGRVSGVQVDSKGAAKRVDLIDQERVRFRNGSLELAGTLYKPRTKGPHPAAVVVHGSGAVSGDLLLVRAQLLIRRGMAVLLYDKRGTGESGGDWRTASFEDLAADAIAAFRYLRTRDDLDQAKLGVVGHSQAGWIIPIVTSREPQLAFALVLSGGAVSPEEQEIFRAEAQTRDDFPRANALQARELMTLMWRYARTGEGWSSYEKAWQAATTEPWFRKVAGPRTSDDPQWQHVRLHAAHDPLPYLKTMRVPTLVILGTDDENLPTIRAADIWRSVARESKIIGSEVIIVRGAGHNLMIRQKDGQFAYAPDYVDAMQKWLQQRGVKMTKLF